MDYHSFSFPTTEMAQEEELRVLEHQEDTEGPPSEEAKDESEAGEDDWDDLFESDDE